MRLTSKLFTRMLLSKVLKLINLITKSTCQYSKQPNLINI